MLKNTFFLNIHLDIVAIRFTKFSRAFHYREDKLFSKAYCELALRLELLEEAFLKKVFQGIFHKIFNWYHF
jgi:hypothetical protein